MTPSSAMRCPTHGSLAALVERTANDEAREVLSAHVDRCETCRAVLVEWARIFVSEGGPTSTSVAVDLAAGAEVDHYVAIRELGRGASGIVWLARDAVLGREVVLKFSARRADARTDPSALVAEGKTLAGVAHPNVVRVLGLGEWRGFVYLAMEAVDGVDLRSLCEQRALEREEARDLLLDVASGLLAIHACGVVHRDVKPENVIVGRDGVARVIDLDLAHRSERHTCRLSPAVVAGTPSYMAPEARAGAPPTPATDVYAFCTMALEVLGLASPFREPGSQTPIPLPRSVTKLLYRGIDPRPEARPTMAELVAALRTEPARTKAPALALSAIALGLAITLLVIGVAGSATAMPIPMPRPASVEQAISAPIAPFSTGGDAAAPAPVLAVAAPTPRPRPSDVRASVVSPFEPRASGHASEARAPSQAFDRAAAARAVNATSVAHCSASWGTPRHVFVRVVFRPSGDVARVSAIATRSDCVRRQFKSLHVTPFVGGEEVVERLVTIVEQ